MCNLKHFLNWKSSRLTSCIFNQVILYSDGSIHVHKLASPVSESAPGERDQVKSLLEEF